VRHDVVIPTIGRPSLAVLLESLARADGPRPHRVFLVDDRRAPAGPLLPAGAPPALADRLTIVRGRAAGPASARNGGWRASRADWVAFLDDDVVPGPDWSTRLVDDLTALGRDVGGSQGIVTVPRPAGRRPTDWERNVLGLEGAWWITADMAYRRDVLEDAGGFDERFPAAYREDVDLALRVMQAGWRLVRGRRTVTHAVRPAGFWVSVALQRGNADDALMHAIHGPGWKDRVGAGGGRRRRHLAITAAGLLAIVALVTGRRRLALAGLAGWLAGTAELAWARLAPGPRTGGEILRMAATSAVLPEAATGWWLVGLARLPRLLRGPARAPRRGPDRRPAAVLLDRDGTLVVDVPYNGDPARVVPMPGAREALDRLRAHRVPLAVVSNQSGVARGSLTLAQVDAVNRRIEEVLGPLGPWFICPHGPGEGCGCRKPSPGLVLRAADALGVEARHCALIGDTGADVEAARAAGARPILVPTPVTRREEVVAAPEIATDLVTAVDVLLGAVA
jgi:histidinol-phosphate phosphatase family protein